MTKVVNFKSGKELFYSLPPYKAVRVAFIQFELNDFNTWAYDKYTNIVTQQGKHTFACGDYVALKSCKNMEFCL